MEVRGEGPLQCRPVSAKWRCSISHHLSLWVKWLSEKVSLLGRFFLRSLIKGVSLINLLELRSEPSLNNSSLTVTKRTGCGLSFICMSEPDTQPCLSSVILMNSIALTSFAMIDWFIYLLVTFSSIIIFVYSFFIQVNKVLTSRFVPFLIKWLWLVLSSTHLQFSMVIKLYKTPRDPICTKPSLSPNALLFCQQPFKKMSCIYSFITATGTYRGLNQQPHLPPAISFPLSCAVVRV